MKLVIYSLWKDFFGIGYWYHFILFEINLVTYYKNYNKLSIIIFNFKLIINWKKKGVKK